MHLKKKPVRKNRFLRLVWLFNGFINTLLKEGLMITAITVDHFL